MVLFMKTKEKLQSFKQSKLTAIHPQPQSQKQKDAKKEARDLGFKMNKAIFSMKSRNGASHDK